MVGMTTTKDIRTYVTEMIDGFREYVATAEGRERVDLLANHAIAAGSILVLRRVRKRYGNGAYALAVAAATLNAYLATRRANPKKPPTTPFL
jgi:hypothetical protein